MDKTEIRKAWVDALRSGKYKQAYGHLHGGEDGGFCCLGVLCDIVKDEPDIKTEWKDSEVSKVYRILVVNNEEASGYLPAVVMNKVGISTNNGEFPLGCTIDNFYGSLMALNDSRKYTFGQIADVIEKHPDWVFVD